MSVSRRAHEAALLAVIACVAACASRPAVTEERACLPAAELMRPQAHTATENEVMNKLDPTLRQLVRDVDKATAHARQVRAAATDADHDRDDACIDAQVEVTVWFEGAVDDLVAAGLDVWRTDRNKIGNQFAAGMIAPTRLLDLAAVPHVSRVQGPPKSAPELHDSVPAIGVKALRDVHPEATGAGVVVAIIDDGFDWRHGSFCDAAGKTRILAIWDLLLGARKANEIGFAVRKLQNPAQREPIRGVYYDQDDINHSLGHSVTKQNPCTVRTVDPPKKKKDPRDPDQKSGHGTHVGGIAAGDGSPLACCRPWSRGRYQGVAPAADIIVVRGGASDTMLEYGLSFIDEIAGAKPVVVNMSSGYNEGPHDGTSNGEESVDLFVAKPARFFVKSAGNEGNTSKHARINVPHKAGSPPVSGTASMDVIIPPEYHGSDSMEVWYSAQRDLELQVFVDDNNRTSPWFGNQTVQTFDLDTENPPTKLDINAVAHAQQNNDRTIQLTARRDSGTLAALTFTLRFRNAGAQDTTVDAWIAKGKPGMTFANPTVESTVTEPGNAIMAITVANHALPSSCCDGGNAVDATSSRGPARVAAPDPGAAKPTLAAPGMSITSAQPDGACCCWPECLESHYQELSGTSMAAPHVAGAIALMLQKNPTLTAQQVRDILRSSATTVSGPAADWGAGKLNAKAAWEAVTAPALAPSPSTTRLAAFAAPTAPVEAQAASVLHPALRLLRDTVRSLPDGELSAALVSRHFSEVRRLVNTNTRVATMWHRADGPRLLRRLAAGAIEPDAPAPLRDDSDRDYLVRMLEQLRRYGSPGLQASIDQHQALVLRMVATPLAAQLGLT